MIVGKGRLPLGNSLHARPTSRSEGYSLGWIGSASTGISEGKEEESESLDSKVHKRGRMM